MAILSIPDIDALKCKGLVMNSANFIRLFKFVCDLGEDFINLEDSYINGVILQGSNLVFTGEGSAFNGSVDLSSLVGSGFVPYIGATSDVDLGANSISALTYNGLYLRTFASFGLAIGDATAGQNATGNQSIHIGAFSGTNCTGRDNVTIGQSAGSNITGRENVAIGLRALGSATNVVGAVALGYEAGENSTAGGIFIGYRAGGDDTAGGIGIGPDALGSNSGNNTIGIGVSALENNTGNSAIGIGFEAGEDNAAIDTIAIGVRAGKFNSGEDLVALGYETGLNNTENNLTSIGARSSGNNVHTNGTFIGAGSNSAPFVPTEDIGSRVTFDNTDINLVPNTITASGHGFGTAGENVNLFWTIVPAPPEYNFGFGDFPLSSGWYWFTVVDANTLLFTVTTEGGPAGNLTVQGTGTGHTLGAALTQPIFDNVTGIGAGAEVTASNQVMLGNTDTEEVVTAGVYRSGGYTVATLPTGTMGDRAYVTDHINTITDGIGDIASGGGANVVPVFFDGTDWRVA